MKFLLGATTGLLLGTALTALVLTGTLTVGAAPCEEDPCPVPPCCNGDVNGDGDIDLSDPVYILLYLFQGGAEPLPLVCQPTGSPCQLPTTGQTTCYDASGAPVDCASTGLPPQDGSLQSGCAPEGRFVDNGDGTVTDTCTNLMWEKAGSSPGKFSWTGALQYCDDLTLGEKDDWHLPNVKELQSLVDYGRNNPTIEPVFSADSNYYWTSTSFDADPTKINAWVVNFLNGFVSSAPKTLRTFVRAVRTIDVGP